jgi:predicted nuclease with TOPRIM domain
MKLILNPWKRIKELEQDVTQLESQLMDSYGETNSLRQTFEEISLVAGPRSSAIVRLISTMAQDAADKFYGFELTEK